MTNPKALDVELEPHKDHTLTTVHLLAQDAGVPYELEQLHCVQCDELLQEGKRRVAA